MAQQRLGGGVDTSTTDSASAPAEADGLDWIDYLDVNDPSLISALAATLDTVDEVEKYIEAEQKRWDRGFVVWKLEARKRALEADTSETESEADPTTNRVFEFPGQRAGSQTEANGDTTHVIS